MGVGDGSLSFMSMGFVSNSFGFFIRLSFLRCAFVKFRVSVFMSLEGFKFEGGDSETTRGVELGPCQLMSSQSRGCSISNSDESESEYSSVEERYGSGSWICCGRSV